MATAEKLPEQNNGRDGSDILSRPDAAALESSTAAATVVTLASVPSTTSAATLTPIAPSTSADTGATSTPATPATLMTPAPPSTSAAADVPPAPRIPAASVTSTTATVPPPTEVPAALVADVETSVQISDYYFMRNLNRLRELRSFLIQEAVGRPDVRLEFGSLNQLRYATTSRGREPTKDEWTQVERLTQSLFQLLTPPLRRRFLLGEIPMWIGWLTAALALLAVATLVAAVVVQNARQDFNAIATTMPFYLVWLMSLGAIGSVAFIGMNALSVQQDVTFDLSNRRLLMLRIILGSLFGLVLTLPFGYDAFKDFIAAVISNKPVDPKSGSGSISTPAMLLLLPFVFGFSTSVVIMVLNRFVDGLQAFFGKPTNADARTEAQTSPSEPVPALPAPAPPAIGPVK
jgi:hypothetical protein